MKFNGAIGARHHRDAADRQQVLAHREALMDRSASVRDRAGQPAAVCSKDVTIWLRLVAVLAVFYGSLQNGYWYGGNSSEVYIVLARNLVQGEGYVFNDLPVLKVAPGWPLILAGLMKLSGSFWVLNAVPAICLIATAAIWYYILRRLTSPARAFVVVLISATLFPWFRLTYLLYSEAVFCLFATWGLLLAFQINENKSGSWRIPLLAVLCSLMVIVRWPGVLSWLLIAGALAANQIKPQWNRQWIALAITGIVVAATFVGLRQGMKYYAERIPPPPVSVTTDASRVQTTLAGERPVVGVSKKALRSYLKNYLRGGHWVSWLFWQQSQVGTAQKACALVVNVFGWIVIAVMLAYMLPQIMARQWMWLGLILACAALFARWPRPMDRYFVPAAPLLIYAAWRGVETVTLGRHAKAIVVLFLGSIVLCNLALYGIDLWAARSANFYGVYQGGQQKGVIEVAHYLNQAGIRDGEVATNQDYVNLGRTLPNSFGLRTLCLLTDRTILVIPKKNVKSEEPNERLIRWARKSKVKYYAYRTPVDPWRLYHFRVPWLQELITGHPAASPRPYFELYELKDGQAIKIDLPGIQDWPRSVPHL